MITSLNQRPEQQQIEKDTYTYIPGSKSPEKPPNRVVFVATWKRQEKYGNKLFWIRETIRKKLRWCRPRLYYKF